MKDARDEIGTIEAKKVHPKNDMTCGQQTAWIVGTVVAEAMVALLIWNAQVDPTRGAIKQP